LVWSLKEAQGIAEELQAEIVLIGHDAAVHTFEKYAVGEPITRTFHGDGGTDFAPTIEKLQEENIEPAVLVFITADMEGHFPEFPPPYPVLWLTAGADFEPPFGYHIDVPEEART
jgi:predicted metal-dependent peptidase